MFMMKILIQVHVLGLKKTSPQRKITHRFPLIVIIVLLPIALRMPKIISVEIPPSYSQWIDLLEHRTNMDQLHGIRLGSQHLGFIF